MLKTLRERNFIKVVMLILVVAFVGTIFVVWGVKSMPGDLARRGVMATVGGSEITLAEYQRALRQEIEGIKQLLGDKVDEKLLDSMNLKQQVLDGLIRRTLIRQYAEQVGIEVSSAELAEEIRQIPAFAGKDGFSKERYLAILQANRLTPDRFEADQRGSLKERRVVALIRDAVKVSDAETREAFREVRRQLTVETVQLPAGEEGKTVADKITLALGQGKSLAVASQEAGISPKVLGPFPAVTPPGEIPDPDAFRQAVGVLRPGEVSPLITGSRASYLLRLVNQQDPPEVEFEKDKATFRAQFLAQKREAVFADWLRQLWRAGKVTVDRENL